MIYFTVGDMFRTHGVCSLAHCISADGKMSRGLAKEFVRRFPTLISLRRRNLDIGVAVPVVNNGRFIYSLVTKERFFNKPEVSKLKSTLWSMSDHADQNGIRTINVPMLGSGLDGLDFFGQVLPAIREVFQESTVIINIHFLRMEDVSLIRYVMIIECCSLTFYFEYLCCDPVLYG